MKPVIVWILLVDRMHARILANQGSETGLVQLSGRVYDAVRQLFCSDDEGGEILPPINRSFGQVMGPYLPGDYFKRCR